MCGGGGGGALVGRPSTWHCFPPFHLYFLSLAFRIYVRVIASHGNKHTYVSLHIFGLKRKKIYIWHLMGYESRMQEVTWGLSCGSK